MNASALRVTLTRTMVALVAMLGAAAVRAETEPVIVTDVFGEYQLFYHLHPWPSGARMRDLNLEAPLPPGPAVQVVWISGSDDGRVSAGREISGGWLWIVNFRTTCAGANVTGTLMRCARSLVQYRQWLKTGLMISPSWFRFTDTEIS